MSAPITKEAAVKILQEGREAIGQIARHLSLTTAQLSRLANADRALESGLALASSTASDADGMLVLRNTARLGANHLFNATKTDLPDSRERDRLLEWQAHFELLARGVPAEASHA